MTTQIVPARWWEAGPFIAINLEMARGRDPWADRIAARPWAPASLLEYLYMLDAFARFDNFIVRVGGRRAGVLSLQTRPSLIYVYSLGLLPQFQHGLLGRQLADFVHNYSVRQGIPVAVASVAAANRPAHVLVRALGGRLLGLATTTLTMTADGPALEAVRGLEVRRLSRDQVQPAWRRWRLHEVEQVAGPEATEIAALVLDGPPRAQHLACTVDGQEVAVAHARQRAGGLEVGLFPSHEHWGQASTLDLMAALARHLRAPVRRLIVTQSHADALCAAWPASLRFERQRDQERHLVFFRRV